MQQASGTRRWTAQHVALVLAAAAALLLTLAPTGSSESVTADSTGTVTESVTHTTTLLQSQGPGVLIVLAVPIVLTLLPLLVPPRTRRAVGLVCAVLLGVLVVLGALTIGMWFLPALIAALVASIGRRPSEVPQS